jgi:hypothetical protein
MHFEVGPPDIFVEMFARQQAPDVPEEKQRQVVLAVPQFDASAPDLDGAPGRKELVGPEDQLGLVQRGIGSAKQSADARLEFGAGDGRDQKIVSTGMKAHRHDGGIGPGRQEKNRKAVSGGAPYRLHQRRTVDPGQAPAQDQQIETLLLHCLHQRGVVRVVVALVSEARCGVVDQPQLIPLVVEYCYAHSIPCFTRLLAKACLILEEAASAGNTFSRKSEQ